MTSGLKINKRTFWYCLYNGQQVILDKDGRETGEKQIVYANPIKASANISDVTGWTTTEMFGNNQDYDRVIAPLPLNCPIDENSVLFIDKQPDFDERGLPNYDYIVRRVAKSLNHIAIAVSKR